MLNSRSKFQKYFRRPISKYTFNHIKAVFNETKEYLASLRCEGVSILHHPRKTFAIGFITTMESVLALSGHLMCNSVDYPLRYFLSYKVSQDHIELLFSCIRSRFRRNNNPDAKDFAAALKSILLHNNIQPSTRGNCENLESTFTNYPISEFRSAKRSLSQLESNTSEELKNLNYSNCTAYYEDNVIYYISGFILMTLQRTVTCPECLGLLFDNVDQHE